MNRVWVDFEQKGPAGRQAPSGSGTTAVRSWEPLATGAPRARVDTGFSWQYLDLVDPAGDGLVLIWAHALPFVPGTVAAERDGRPLDPAASPSLCVAVYQGGRCTFYALQALDPRDVRGDTWAGSRFSGVPGAMHIELDLEVPGGERLTGCIHTEGSPVQLAGRGGSPHRWAPLAIGSGRAELRCGALRVDLDGRAYHDTNSSTAGLTSLGIRRWIWGRVPHPHGESVHYLLESNDPLEPTQHHLLDIDRSGRVEARRVPATWGPDRRGAWGLSAPRELRVDGRRVEHVRALEDGPFYQRWQLRAEDPSGVMRAGVGEVVDVTRMDRAPFGPLVGMAVHRPSGSSSPFVPLFCGPSRGRFVRLLRHWTGR
jgi:hypothetical protein